ncbi:MAG TPA: hypothetical protein ENJ29_13480 [Bacteroidetes bacterium]|nr:hypothetical protein [Bacteroidota bacterium]
MQKLFFPAVLILALLPGCTKKIDKDEPLRNPEFVRIYAEAALLKQDPDSLRARQRIDSLLLAHDMDSTKLAEEIAYLREKPQRWKKFYQQVVRILDTKRKEARKRRQAERDSSAAGKK